MVMRLALALLPIWAGTALVGGAAADLPPVSSWVAGGTCDGECDYCWCGTAYEEDCPIEWFYDADCDCGCQFCDAACMCSIQDCRGGATVGACCCPILDCGDGTTQADCLSFECVYQGDGSTCASGCPCDDMPQPCNWCWVGTSFENNCPQVWHGTNDGCDCGCQWVDPDCQECAGQVCCTIPGDLTGDSLVDLDDHSLHAGCLLGPGTPVSDNCACTDFDADGDVDLQDVAGYQRALEGS